MRDQPKKQRCPHCHASNSADSLYCSSCGSPLAVENTRSYVAEPEEVYKVSDGLDFPPGQVFAGRYLIIEELGRGGMGRVFKARDQKLGITVALKMIRPEYSSNPAVIDLFTKETLLARSLTQENIIRIFDLGESQGLPFISMEFVSGQNLGQLMRASGALTEETTVSIAGQVCQALVAAQAKGIVHRDLKPQNILVDANGRVHLADFGLAKSLEAMEATRAGGVVGTPPYLSPEQAKGEKVDTRADIYALGIIMYEMLTGRRPFQSDSTAGYIDKHIHEKPAPPSRWNSHIPPYLEKITLHCLEKDPAKRFQSAADVLKALTGPDELQSAGAARRRKRVRTALFFSTLALLLVVLGTVFLGHKKPSVPPPGGRISVAVVWFENNTGDQAFEHYRKALACEIIQNLLQSRFIRVITDDRIYEILQELDLIKNGTYSTTDLKRVATRAQADYVLHGGLSKIGNLISINTLLHRANTWELVGSHRVEDTSERNLPQMIDRLTPQVKASLIPHEQVSADFRLPITAMTSFSEAWNHYSSGMSFYNEQNYAESNRELLQALSLDPEFALALWAMAVNDTYMDKPAEAKNCLEKAMALAAKGRLSFRDQCLIRGFYGQNYEQSPSQAIDQYQKLLAVYPDDEEGNIFLGAVYRNLEDWDRAEEYFLRAQSINRRNNAVYASLSQIFMAKGQYDRARAFLQRFEGDLEPRYFFWLLSNISLCQGRLEQSLREIASALENAPDWPPFLISQGHSYLLAGDFDSAGKSYRRAAAKDPLSFHLWPTRMSLAQLALLLGHIREGRAVLSESIKFAQKTGSKSDESAFHIFSAFWNFDRGSFGPALDDAQKALALAKSSPEQNQALHVLGLVQTKMKRDTEALATAEKLKALITRTGCSKHMRYYHHLLGRYYLERNDPARAAQEATRAVALLSSQKTVDDEHGLFFESLAEALEAQGNLSGARRSREAILSLTTGRLQWETIYVTNFLRLGRLYQKLGLTNEARSAYQKFLGIWKDADRGLPEVEEARREIALLRPASIPPTSRSASSGD